MYRDFDLFPGIVNLVMLKNTFYNLHEHMRNNLKDSQLKCKLN